MVYVNHLFYRIKVDFQAGTEDLLYFSRFLRMTKLFYKSISLV